MTLKELMTITGSPLRVGVSSSRDVITYLERIEVKKGPLLDASAGIGASIDDAISDYCRKISNQLIVKNAYGDDRQEFRLLRVTAG